PQNMEIVQAIIVMAHTLHLKVVTEGVETPAQLEFLSQFGSDYVQGYLFSKPQPLERILPLVREMNGREPASLWPASLMLDVKDRDAYIPRSLDLFDDLPGAEHALATRSPSRTQRSRWSD
uniref:EAL domain-containing protein n=1 Tax=Pseudomonas viridiflava TaxID=33069 RepID=UPI0013C2DE3C